MLDIALVREKTDLVKQNEQKRNRDPKTVDDVLSFDKKWKSELQKAEQLKQKRNVVSLEINSLKKAGKSGTAKIKEMKEVVEEIKKQEEKAAQLLEKRDASLSRKR